MIFIIRNHFFLRAKWENGLWHAPRQRKDSAGSPSKAQSYLSYGPCSHSLLQAHHGVKDGRIKTKFPRSNIPPSFHPKLVLDEWLCVESEF